MAHAELIGQKIAEVFNNFIVGVLHGITVALWYIQKFIATIVDAITNNNLWSTFTDTIMANLEAKTPQVITDVLVGKNGGIGLLWIALFFVGAGFIVPILSVQGQKIARLDHVVIYTIFVGILFTSNTAVGYDLISELEKSRQKIATNVAGAFSTNKDGDDTTTGLSALVSNPVQATTLEMKLDTVSLPINFLTRYHPPAVTTIYRVEYEFKLGLGAAHCPPFLCSDYEVEDQPSREIRRKEASHGMIVMVMNFLPTAFTAMLGAASLMLTISAWVLIFFLIFSVPIGLFEFGSVIQARIITRYIFIWALTILISGLSGTVANLATNVFTVPDPTKGFGTLMTDLATYTVMMSVAILLIYYVVQITYNTMTSSFDTVQQSLKASLSPMALEAGVRMPATGSQAALIPPVLAAGALAAPTAASIATSFAMMGASRAGGFDGTNRARWESKNSIHQTPKPTPNRPARPHTFQDWNMNSDLLNDDSVIDEAGFQKQMVEVNANLEAQKMKLSNMTVKPISL